MNCRAGMVCGGQIAIRLLLPADLHNIDETRSHQQQRSNKGKTTVFPALLRSTRKNRQKCWRSFGVAFTMAALQLFVRFSQPIVCFNACQGMYR